MPNLTVLEIRSMKDPGRLADGGGLFFEYTPSGIKRWLYRYKIDGKGGNYIIGRYPELSLAEARKMHLKAREFVRQGLNPSRARKEVKRQNIANEKSEVENAFENVAREWVEKKRSGCSNSRTVWKPCNSVIY